MKDYPFIVDVDAGEYHEAARRGEFLSSHMLGDFRTCPLLYKKKMTGEIEQMDTAAYQTGRAIHTLVLEGQGRFDEEYLVSDGPVNPKTGESFGKLTKAYKEWSAAQKRPVVSTADYGFMLKLRTSVWLNPVANTLLERGRPEGTVRIPMADEPCQIRMDWFNPDYEGRPVICGLKTCDNLSFFERDAKKYGYPEQLAFYRGVFAEASGGEFCDVYIIAVEKREPFRCGVWKLTDELLDQAHTANLNAIDRLRECRRTATWPTDFEDVRILDVY